jgi:hypothetical protein
MRSLDLQDNLPILTAGGVAYQVDREILNGLAIAKPPPIDAPVEVRRQLPHAMPGSLKYEAFRI